MKLLLDENLSGRIVPLILDFYPDSTHVKSQGLSRADDVIIWEFARKHGYFIVSKDADFHQPASFSVIRPGLSFCAWAMVQPVASQNCFA